MYSPSLVSMLLHSIWTDVAGPVAEPRERHFTQTHDLVDLLREAVNRYENRRRPMPTVPMVGRSFDWPSAWKYLDRSQDNPEAQEYGEDWFESSEAPDEPGGPNRFFWGRVPLNRLVAHFAERHEVPSEVEYWDLGTPLRNFGETTTAAEDACARLLDATGTSTAEIIVAIIDRGDLGTKPEDFKGKLIHADTSGVQMSNHACEVLSVLLERLDFHKALPFVQCFCALVKPPKKPIGRRCFKHANTVEMLAACKKLETKLAADKRPVAFNLSLGAHVGPHNGNSPLEDYVQRFTSPGRARFLHSAVGNDGLRGVAGRLELKAGMRDFMKVRLGPNGALELLIEFWWEDISQTSLMVEVAAEDSHGRPVLDSQLIPSTAGSTMATFGPSFNSITCSSLIHQRCFNAMSCIAFAMSTNAPGGMPSLDLEFAFESQVDIVVNAWITVCEDQQTAFIGGSNDSAICVPASAPNIVSVAGIDAHHKPWSRSSRGPASNYQPGNNPGYNPAPGAPSMAHFVESRDSGEKGTSYASPRACADAAEVLRDSKKRGNCTSTQNLVSEILSLGGSGLSPWNPRTGSGFPRR